MNKMNRNQLRDGIQVKISEDFIKILLYVGEYFDGDALKVKSWLTTKNLNFGGIEPLKLMAIGKEKKVLAFIEESRESWPKPRDWTLALIMEGELASYAPITEIVEGEHLPPGVKVKVREVLKEKPLLGSSPCVETTSGGQP